MELDVTFKRERERERERDKKKSARACAPTENPTMAPKKRASARTKKTPPPTTTKGNEEEEEEDDDALVEGGKTTTTTRKSAKSGTSREPIEKEEKKRDATTKKDEIVEGAAAVANDDVQVVLDEAKRNLVLESGNRVFLTPILGGIREDAVDDANEPLCYLLQIDQTNVLLDCGWDDKFDQNEYIKELQKIAPTLDCVLISHCTQRHIGAVPLLFSERVKCNPNCKIYASIPTHKLGQMLCYDIALGYSEFRGEFGEDFGYSLDDVDLAFSKFVPVKYQQHSRVTLKRESIGDGESAGNSNNSNTNSGIVVEAINAGHTLGGSCWRISKDAEDIVYAVDYNMRKERHLAGTSLAETVHRPSVLITDCRNVDRKAPEARLQVRDLPLVDCVLKHARMEGNVVICCDAVGRTLELALLLEETWMNQNLGSYQLVLFNNVAANALEFVRSHLEWMNEDVGLKFDSTRQNVFDVKKLFPCHSYEDFTRLPPGPKVVLASLASLEAGFARKLFVEWASDAKNCFIWPDEIGHQVGLAREVVEMSNKGGAKTTSSKTKKKDIIVKVDLARRETLSGKELEVWKQEQEKKLIKAEKRKEEEAKRLAEEEEKKRLLEEEMDVDAATLSQPLDEDIDGDNKPDKTMMEEEGGKAGRLVPPPQVNEETGIALREKQLAFERRDCIVDGFIPDSFEHLVFPDETKFPSSEPSGMSARTEYGEAIDDDAFFRVANELRPEMTRDQSFESTGDVDKLADVDNMDATIASASLTDKQHNMDTDATPDEDKVLERPAEIPTKIVKETKEIVVKAAIESNFDYDGLADGRSVKAIIPRLEPRRVILVSGTLKDAENLSSHLYNDSEHFPKSSKIHYPKNNETLDASSVHPTYKVRLSEAVLSSARLRQVSGYAVGWIDGVIGPIPEDGTAPELLPVPVNALKLTVSKSVKDESLLAGKVANPSLVKKETTSASLAVTLLEDNKDKEGTKIDVVTKHHRRSAFVGDVRLSEFRRYLQRMGVPAEFGEGGALVCANGQVIVRRRAEDDELIVEGSISDAYYNVRDALYAQYQIL